jgi:hypothetical protein
MTDTLLELKGEYDTFLRQEVRKDVWIVLLFVVCESISTSTSI